MELGVPVGRRSWPAPPAEGLPEPRDEAFKSTIRLEVDATDVARRIIWVRQTIAGPPPGRFTLLYPEWLPGYHSPRAALELFAGLIVRIDGDRVEWRRDPVEVHAFHLDVPEGASTLEAEFQFVSPTTDAQGTVVVTDDILDLQWHACLLYPAGHFARRITYEPSVKLPEGWRFACALETAEPRDERIAFKPAPLDVLVDSPLLAGRIGKTLDLDPEGLVRLNLFAHAAADLETTDEQIETHRRLIDQADRLFGSRRFDHYDFLVALSSRLGATGVEHHRSCEITTSPGYFSEWQSLPHRRDTLAHEYVHAWNGKHRRGADSWTPNFQGPIRNSLMWVYEGLTQYWGRVLATRSGLWSLQDCLDALAQTAASYDVRVGRCWRTMSDTTRDPIIVGREPTPWPSWQRGEDYYAEGELVWLGVDTLIRQLSGGRRSLDDFARSFFGGEDGDWETRTYVREDVMAALNQIAPHDWEGFFTEKLESHGPGAPLDGLERGGYRLVYRDYQSDFCAKRDAELGQTNLMFSIGLVLSGDGSIEEVLWDSPCFEARLISGAQLVAVNGKAYQGPLLKDAVAATAEGAPLELTVKTGTRVETVAIRYGGGLRYPHLAEMEEQRRIDRIYAPLA
jgi:predicted metalloprotease with PDZ domain